jgi:hypothetical protein
MKIATWNLERFNKSSNKNQLIIDGLTKMNADILILTETNETINLGDSYHCFHSAKLEEPYYKEGERRVSIYSRYKSVGKIKTFRDDTSICTILRTPLGDLAVYGTIIGVGGNRRPNFVH